MKQWCHTLYQYAAPTTPKDWESQTQAAIALADTLWRFHSPMAQPL